MVTIIGLFPIIVTYINGWRQVTKNGYCPELYKNVTYYMESYV